MRPGAVAAGGERARGGEVAQAQPSALVEAAQQAGEVAGGEGVAGAGRFDDVDGQGGLGGDAVAGEGGRPVPGVLDDDGGGSGEHRAQGVRVAGAEGVLGLVRAEQQDVGGAEQGGQDAGVAVAPQAGPPVEVEADGPAGAAVGEQGADERQAAVGEGGGDAGQMQEPGAVEEPGGGGVGEQGGGEGGGRGARPVVVQAAAAGAEVVRQGRAAGLLHVEAGGPVRVDGDGGDVHAAGGEVGGDPAAEAVVADAADPGGGHAEGGEAARGVGLRPADRDAEAAGGLQRAGPVGQQHRHRLAEADRLRAGPLLRHAPHLPPCR